MNILINMSTLKLGGGQNVGLNFVKSLPEIDVKGITFFFAVAEGTEIHSFLIKNKYKRLLIYPINPIKRILKEILVGSFYARAMKIDVIYSYFGYGHYGRRIPQVSGVADSNLFFPEINFWRDYSGIRLIHKKIIDKYRKSNYSRASGLIFENEEMLKRSDTILKKDISKILIKPSFTEFNNISDVSTFNRIDSDCKTFLFLCGWQLNKNIMLIPDLAMELKKRHINAHFIITAPDDESTACNNFKNRAKKLDVIDCISIIGRVPKTELPSLYNKTDYVCLLSRLESFSNNIIEAWYYRKLLIVADAKWSRSICNEAALYVSNNSAEDAADQIVRMFNNREKEQYIIEKGTNEFLAYPNTRERTELEIEFLKGFVRK